MQKFLRDNLLIVASILLPLLVVAIFAVASFIPRLYTEAPAFALLLAQQSPGYSAPVPAQIIIRVAGKRVVAHVARRDDDRPAEPPRLYLYDPAADELRELLIELPEDWNSVVEGDELAIPELGSRRVSSALRAPDGYEFRGRQWRRNGMLGLFGGRRNRSDVSIAKNGAIIRIPIPGSDRWYRDVQFVGWLIPAEGDDG